MTVPIGLIFSEAEADALIRAHKYGRDGWQPRPSFALQTADAKIIGAIASARGVEVAS